MKHSKRVKVKKDKTGIKAGVKTIFYFYLVMLSAFAMLGILVLFEGSAVIPATLLFGLFFICVLKLMMVQFGPLLKDENGRKLKKENKKALFILFNVMLVCTLLYLSGIEISRSDDFELMVSSIVQVMIWIIPCLLFGMLVINLMVTGKVRIFFSKCAGFIKEYVSVYLTYRAIIFGFTLLASVIMVAIMKIRGGASETFVVSGYFQYILDASLSDTLASGFLSGEGTFLSGLTAASSYMVLSSFALEYINGNEDSFAVRLKGMFFESDTIKLLVMSIICIIATVMPSGEGINILNWSISKSSVAIVFIMWIMWILSMISFVKGTKIVPYLLNFFTLYFVERIVYLPAVNGIGGFLIGIVLTAVRISLFAAIAMMIALFEKSEYTSIEKLAEDEQIDEEELAQADKSQKVFVAVLYGFLWIIFAPMVIAWKIVFGKYTKEDVVNKSKNMFAKAKHFAEENIRKKQ